MRTRYGWRRGAVLLLTAAAIGCGGEPPVRHPVTMIQDRMRPRIALVEFVVKDQDRQERVTEILLEMEAMTFEWQRRRLDVKRALLGVRDDPNDPLAGEETVAALFVRHRELHLEYLARYTALQLALRENLTPEEFARLDGIK